MNLRMPILVACVTTAALAPAAMGHVTANPASASAGSFSKIDFRVPNERDAKATVKLTVTLPPGMFFVSFKSKPGWKRSVTRETVDPAVTLFGTKITDRISSVTWSGGRIRAGEFDEFSISGRIPTSVGATLRFPASQFYSGGEVVKWTDASEEADLPAPRIRITKAVKE